ncbi:MAG: hypothetical protein ACKO1U_07505 [Bacteroidota bacterium]
MKRSSYLFALSILSYFCQTPTNSFGQSNFGSVDPFLPLFGTYQVHYERKILDRLSVVGGVGLKASSGIFEINGLQTESINLNDVDFSGYKILPEVRWYVSKEDPGLWGFYAGLYYKYQKNSSNITGSYTSSDGSLVMVDMDLMLHSNTFGIELGYKLKVWKNLFADFIIAGPGLSAQRAIITENVQLPEKFYERFNEAADNYSVLKDLEPKLNFTKEDLDTKFITPHFRYGIKLGWAF